MHDGSLDAAGTYAEPTADTPMNMEFIARLDTDPSERRGIGTWCREIYWRLCLRPKNLLDPASPLGQHVLIPIYYAIRLVFFTARDWLPVRRQRGISLWRQLADQWALMCQYRTDPSVYYSSQLYDQPRGIREIEDYVGRDEIKNGLMKQLHGLQPKIYGRRISLGNKLAFTQHCRGGDLPVASLICVVDRGHWRFEGDSGQGADGQAADYRRLDENIFVKPVKARGARGAEWFDWLGDDRYRNKQGRELSRVDVISYINRKSRREAILVLQKLVNHAEIGDLAKDSLMVFRIFTCLDAWQQPHVTHAMLRILAKLEPSWPESIEYAARVDLSTGRLGELCDDYHFAPDAWWDHHPTTGVAVKGRLISQWPNIVELATTAHRRFVDRTIIGWDIALTDQGPILIEGNAYPDTHFMQRVHRQFIGKSPMAPLLRQHLSRLAAHGPTIPPRGVEAVQVS
ncbi:MAG TPA: sugar-transfer associated ATP-grasp domain-containing protein [Dongiaceae bacterium]